MTTNTPQLDAPRPAWMDKYAIGDNSEYTAGSGEPFGVVSTKGKVWTAKYGALSVPLTANGYPVPYFNCIIVRGATHGPAHPELAGKSITTKTYYATGYVEGSTKSPDCASANGLVPDIGVPNRQSHSCLQCMHNIFGSAKDTRGLPAKGKACQDNKRIVVLPEGDLVNAMFGGPMLLRVTPSSFAAFNTYAGEMERSGRPLHAIVTRMAFVATVSHPQIEFRFESFVDEDEIVQILKWRSDAKVERMLQVAEAASDLGPIDRIAMFDVPEPEPMPPAPDQQAQAVERAAATKAAFGAPASPPVPNGVSRGLPPELAATAHGKANGNGSAIPQPVAPPAPQPVAKVNDVPAKLSPDEIKAARLAKMRAEMEALEAAPADDLAASVEAAEASFETKPVAYAPIDGLLAHLDQEANKLQPQS